MSKKEWEIIERMMVGDFGKHEDTPVNDSVPRNDDVSKVMDMSYGVFDEDGAWRTINGTHVFIENGEITKGPAALTGRKSESKPAVGSKVNVGGKEYTVSQANPKKAAEQKERKAKSEAAFKAVSKMKDPADMSNNEIRAEITKNTERINQLKDKKRSDAEEKEYQNLQARNVNLLSAGEKRGKEPAVNSKGTMTPEALRKAENRRDELWDKEDKGKLSKAEKEELDKLSSDIEKHYDKKRGVLTANELPVNKSDKDVDPNTIKVNKKDPVVLGTGKKGIAIAKKQLGDDFVATKIEGQSEKDWHKAVGTYTDLVDGKNSMLYHSHGGAGEMYVLSKSEEGLNALKSASQLYEKAESGTLTREDLNNAPVGTKVTISGMSYYKTEDPKNQWAYSDKKRKKGDVTTGKVLEVQTAWNNTKKFHQGIHEQIERTKNDKTYSVDISSGFPKSVKYDGDEYYKAEEMSNGARSYVRWDDSNNAQYITVGKNGKIERN